MDRVQLAFACASLDEFYSRVDLYSKNGFKNWVYDVCTQTGYGRYKTITVHLAYNYDMYPGHEFEIVHYSHDERNLFIDRPFVLSHIGYHTDSVEYEVRSMNFMGVKPLYKFVTLTHTNEAIVGKKRFKEALFDTRNLYGFDMKAIQRIPWESDETWET
ncbi:MAG TPA: hypothetical protein VH593_13415 [Ktedonobacteraceae bacterium]|jgi:hypothetical protein